MAAIAQTSAKISGLDMEISLEECEIVNAPLQRHSLGTARLRGLASWGERAGRSS
jgi:hypothetical protein